MSRKPLRTFICAAAAAALGTFGPLAQATFYGGNFDPPVATGHFTGRFLLDITDSCFSEGSEPCRVDLINLIIDETDHFTSGLFSAGQANIADSASLANGLNFSSVPIPLTFPPIGGDLVLAALGTLDQVDCPNVCVQFTEVFDIDFAGHGPGWIANLYNTQVADNAIYIAAQVPEPGTLGLLVGGIGAAWLRRRRKTIA